MENTISERVNAIMEAKRLNINNFSKELGKSYTSIHAIIKGNSKPGYDFLECILETYPDINPGWLMTGKGDMYLPAAPIEKPASAGYLHDHLKTLEENFARLASQLESKDTQILAKDTQIDRLTRMLESVLGKHEDTPAESRVKPLWSELKEAV